MSAAGAEADITITMLRIISQPNSNAVTYKIKSLIVVNVLKFAFALFNIPNSFCQFSNFQQFKVPYI